MQKFTPVSLKNMVAGIIATLTLAFSVFMFQIVRMNNFTEKEVVTGTVVSDIKNDMVAVNIDGYGTVLIRCTDDKIRKGDEISVSKMELNTNEEVTDWFLKK